MCQNLCHKKFLSRTCKMSQWWSYMSSLKDPNQQNSRMWKNLCQRCTKSLVSGVILGLGTSTGTESSWTNARKRRIEYKHETPGRRSQFNKIGSTEKDEMNLLTQIPWIFSALGACILTEKKRIFFSLSWSRAKIYSNEFALEGLKQAAYLSNFWGNASVHSLWTFSTHLGQSREHENFWKTSCNFWRFH